MAVLIQIAPLGDPLDPLVQRVAHGLVLRVVRFLDLCRKHLAVGEPDNIGGMYRRREPAYMY